MHKIKLMVKQKIALCPEAHSKVISVKMKQNCFCTFYGSIEIVEIQYAKNATVIAIIPLIRSIFFYQSNIYA